MWTMARIDITPFTLNERFYFESVFCISPIKFQPCPPTRPVIIITPGQFHWEVFTCLRGQRSSCSCRQWWKFFHGQAYVTFSVVRRTKRGSINYSFLHLNITWSKTCVNNFIPNFNNRFLSFSKIQSFAGIFPFPEYKMGTQPSHSKCENTSPSHKNRGVSFARKLSTISWKEQKT